MDRTKLFQIGAIALACFTAWAAFHIIDAPPMTRAEVADWVQGLGSIAAVAVAAWVGLLPLRHAEARRQTDRENVMTMAVEGASLLRMQVDYYRKVMDRSSAETANIAVHALKNQCAEQALEAVLRESIQSWPSLAVYQRSRDLVVCYQGVIQKGLDIVALGTVWNDDSLKIIDLSIAIFDNAFDYFEKVVARQGELR